MSRDDPFRHFRFRTHLGLAVVECHRTKYCFRGPVSVSSVILRVIARKALELNAGAEVLCQNHVEGDVVPRDNDRELSGKVKDALALFGIQLLDCIFVSKKDSYSLAEYELL